MEIVEPQRPDSGRHVGIEDDCRGRSGTMVINESGEGRIVQYINRNMHKQNDNQILAVSR